MDGKCSVCLVVEEVKMFLPDDKDMHWSHMQLTSMHHARTFFRDFFLGTFHTKRFFNGFSEKLSLVGLIWSKFIMMYISVESTLLW